jgi:RNA polymerase sporulation-specific sigma factor
MAVASKKEILEHLDSINLNELLDRMEDYVRGRFYNKSEKIRKGIDYLDFCYDVLTKACNGVRNWDKEKITFEEFVFGCLRSDLYNFFRKLANSNGNILNKNIDKTDNEVYIIEVNEFTELDEIGVEDPSHTMDFDQISNDVLLSLKEQGADELEIQVFECWVAGYYKPREIAELCETDVKKINIAIKRLSRKTIKIKEKWISLKKG